MVRLEFVVEVIPVCVRDTLELRDLCVVCSLRMKPDCGFEPECLCIESCVYVLVPESFANVLVSALVLFLARRLLAFLSCYVLGLVVLFFRVLQLLGVCVCNVSVERSILGLESAFCRVVELEDFFAQCVGLYADGVESLYEVLVDLYKTRSLLVELLLLFPSAFC
jgi:hypothetical protein